MAHSGTNAQVDRHIGTDDCLAIDGGKPIRERWLPYGRQTITDADIESVTKVLRSDWLTQGPSVADFELALRNIAGTKYAIAVSNGTAALHAAYFACGITYGDEIITSGMTFAATANAALYLGATPRFADIDLETGNINVASAEKLINAKTKAIVAVDYAGQPCQYTELRALCDRFRLHLIADAAHSIGGCFQTRPVGSLADITTFSFHPVKTITTGEGGAVVTDNETFAERALEFRTHGITKDPKKLQRRDVGPWYYEIQDIGFNYRLTDIQAALGTSQLANLPSFIRARQELALRYDALISNLDGIRTLKQLPNVQSAHHLYPVFVEASTDGTLRKKYVEALHAENIGVQVHYIPVYQHPAYLKLFGPELRLSCPNTERFYASVFSLPLFPSMTGADQDDVVAALSKINKAYSS